MINDKYTAYLFSENNHNAISWIYRWEPDERAFIKYQVLHALFSWTNYHFLFYIIRTFKKIIFSNFKEEKNLTNVYNLFDLNFLLGKVLFTVV